MRRTLCALFTLGAVGVVSLTVEASCDNVPGGICRGISVNAKPGANGEVDDNCTECVEANCCDDVGDCQSTDCAKEVASAHKCVLEAGRRAAVQEGDCQNAALRSDQSKKVYACMRKSCGDQCGLPTCKLEPLVPRIGTDECDRCFARACCSLMNECAKNRTCLLTLRCIVDECGSDLSKELEKSAHPQAIARRDLVCSDAGGPPPTDDGGDDPSCLVRCIKRTYVADSAEAAQARCLAAQINECGAEVDCGGECAPKDAAAD